MSNENEDPLDRLASAALAFADSCSPHKQYDSKKAQATLSELRLAAISYSFHHSDAGGDDMERSAGRRSRVDGTPLD